MISADELSRSVRNNEKTPMTAVYYLLAKKRRRIIINSSSTISGEASASGSVSERGEENNNLHIEMSRVESVIFDGYNFIPSSFLSTSPTATGGGGGGDGATTSIALAESP